MKDGSFLFSICMIISNCLVILFPINIKKTLIESKSIVLLLSYFVFPRPSIKFVYLFLRYQYPSYHTLKIFLFLRQLIYRLNCFLVKSSFLLRGYSANDLYFLCLLIYLIIQSTFIHIYREEI